MKIRRIELPVLIIALIVMLLAFSYFGIPFLSGLSWSEAVIIGSIMLGFDAIGMAILWFLDSRRT